MVGYAFAWYAHFFVEGNKPATFGHPFYSLVADYRMLFLMFAEARALVPNWHPIYRDSYTIESLVNSILSGRTVGPNRRITSPPRSIRNLVKFHLIAFVPKKPRRAFFKYL